MKQIFSQGFLPFYRASYLANSFPPSSGKTGLTMNGASLLLGQLSLRTQPSIAKLLAGSLSA